MSQILRNNVHQTTSSIPIHTYRVSPQPAAALSVSLFHFLDHLTEPLDDQQWQQSVSPMYTKPGSSHDLLHTCSLKAGRRQHSLHSSFTPAADKPSQGQESDFLLFFFHVSTVYCCNSAKAIPNVYAMCKLWLFCSSCRLKPQ